MIDLLVAGGGPSGLATALFAARAGLRAVVLEPRAGTQDKACGEGIMPGALATLLDLGVDPIGCDLNGIRYLGRGSRAEAHFSRGPGRGVRRTTLHDALTAAVTGAGVEICQGHVAGVWQTADAVHAGGMRARYLVAADGLHSPIRALLGLSRPHRGPARYGLRRHFALAPWADLVEVHWASDAEAYVTPVAPDLVGVAVLSARRATYEEHIRRFPALADRLGNLAVTPARGAARLRQDAVARRSGRVLLVGDAAGYVDAITGEGIALAVASARAAVRCIAADRPQAYERAWRAASRRSRLITAAVLAARQRPALAGALVPAAQRLPGLFALAVDALAG